MAMISPGQYLTQVETAWNAEDGIRVSALLSFRNPHVMNSRLQLEHPEITVERFLRSPLDELLTHHLRCVWAVSNHNFVEAYRSQSLLVQTLVKVLQAQKDQNWALPIMFVICLDLRLFANSADFQIMKAGKGKPGETLEKAAEGLMNCFRVCAGDTRSERLDSKRWGMLNVVNQLFKIYFRINKLHLCRPLIRAIESSPYKDQFSLSQLVTYRYYTGRKAMFESDYKTAETALTFSFERCHKSCKTNKRLILIYLIPVKMLLGHMPVESLLKKYELIQFLEVVRAVKKGHLKKLNEALGENEAFFIKCGVYLILEKLKVITYRNLFKKVYLLSSTHQIPISSFTTALRLMGLDDVDDDETACLIANLICDSRMKGYISHSHQKVVVSKKDAFPPLAGI